MKQRKVVFLAVLTALAMAAFAGCGSKDSEKAGGTANGTDHSVDGGVLENTVDDAKDAADEVKDDAKDAADEIKDDAKDAADDVKDGAGNAADQTKRMVNDVTSGGSDGTDR